MMSQRSIFGNFFYQNCKFSCLRAHIGKTIRDSDIGLSRPCFLDNFLHENMHFEASAPLLFLHIALETEKIKTGARQRRRLADRYGLEKFTLDFTALKMRISCLKLISDSNLGPQETPKGIKIAYRST